MSKTLYGDISPRTAGYAVGQFLKRALPYLIIERFGQVFVIPNNKTKIAIFRRYEALANTPNALTEGVTPTAKSLTKTDVSAQLAQYGDLITISDVVMDTHEDPILQQAIDVLGEQAAQMIEIVRFNVIKAGTNVFYANGSQRSSVNTKITTTLQRRIVRTLKRQNTAKITSIIRSTPSYETANVAPAYVCLHHPDAEGDVRDMTNFTPSERYGSVSPWENETGKVEEVRFVWSTIFAPWINAGGAAGAMISTNASAADVYPFMFLGRDAYGIVPLRGQQSLTPMVVNPTSSDSDPLAQRGHVAWKSMQTAVILNDAFMSRLEAGCTQ
jgi:N4-gp56 family major capsid protein